MSSARKFPPHQLSVLWPDGERGSGKRQTSFPFPGDEPDTLCRFFDGWFKSFKLAKSSSKTRLVYVDAMRWYRELSGDPPWHEIDAELLTAYERSLRTAKYQRGNLGKPRTLAAATYNKLLNHWLAVVKAAIAKRYLDEDLYYVLPESNYKPSPGERFALEELRTLYASIDSATDAGPVTGPKGPLDVCDFWRLFLALAFYVGERRGTLLALRREHLEDRGEAGLWFVIPGEIVSKTQKGDAKPVHPFLLPLVERSPTLLAGYKADQIGRQFRRLKDFAGVRQLKLHAIRASHSQALGELGLAYAEGIAQATLQHSSARITRDHYVSIRDKLLPKLPSLGH